MAQLAVIAVCIDGVDRASLHTMSQQLVQMTLKCAGSNIIIADTIILHTKADRINALLKEVKRVDARLRFNNLIVYSPTQIAQNKTEYNDFVTTLQRDFSVNVKAYRGVE